MNKLYWVPIVLIGLLIGLLFFKTDKDFIIISQPVITSSVESSSLETLSYSFLTNQPDRYEFNTDYIIKGEIITSERYLPVDIIDVKETTLKKVIDGETYCLIVIEYKPAILIDKGLIQYDSASLVIHYENNKELSLLLGEFNYAFNQDTKDLSLGALKATTEVVKEVESIGGIAIELGNQTASSLVIQNIQVFSQTIRSNQDAIILYDKDIDYKDKVINVLGVTTYDFFTETNAVPLNQSIRSKQSISLYVPLLYLGEIHHVGRLSLVVTYTLNGETKTTFIDDFPFMRYDLFDESLKDNWVIQNGD